MYTWPALVFLICATAATGLLAGASLDQSIKQLPSRRRVGIAAFSRYSQAADLSNGIAFYASLGIAVLLLNIGAAVAVYVQTLSTALTLPVYLGALLAIFHSIVTVLPHAQTSARGRSRMRTSWRRSSIALNDCRRYVARCSFSISPPISARLQQLSQAKVDRQGPAGRGSAMELLDHQVVEPQQTWIVQMLKWALIFLVISIIAGAFGFTGVAAGAATIARVLFGLFLLLALLFFILLLTGVNLVT